jgi:hypothetical protein
LINKEELDFLEQDGRIARWTFKDLDLKGGERFT